MALNPPTNEKEKIEASFSENASQALNPDNTPEDIVTFYDKWKDCYDEQVKPGFGSGKACAELLLQYTGDMKNMEILDIGAGTGLLGEELGKHGYTNIDGLDPSGGMLQKAQEKKIYRKTFQCFFTDNVECLQTDSYDCVVSNGAFGACQVQPSALTEVIRCVKPGGYVCIITRPEYISSESLMGKEMARLEKEGYWQKLENKIVPNYVYTVEGCAVFFQDI